MHRIGRTFGLLAVSFLALACQRQRVTEIRYLTFAPIHTRFDPAALIYIADYFIVRHLWTPLAYIGADGEVTSDLASEWKHSPDGREWKFKLRPNLKWSDGSLMTAAAVLRSVIAATQGTALARNIKSVELEDADRIRIRLAAYDPGFIAILGGADQVVRDASGAVDLLQPSRVSGPYRLKRVADERLELEPNPFFRPDLPRRPLPVVLIGAVPAEEEAARLEHGQAEIANVLTDFLDDEASKALRAQGIEELHGADETWVSALTFGRRGRSRISASGRQAIFRRVSSAAASAVSAVGDPAFGMIPPYRVGALKPGEWKAALERLPSSVSPPIGLELFVLRQLRSSRSYRLALETLEQTPWLRVREVIYDQSPGSAEALRRFHGGDFDLLFSQTSLSDPDPDLTWRQLYRLTDGVVPVTVEARLSRAAAEADPALRARDYAAIEYANFDDPRMIPLRWIASRIYMRPFFKPPPSGPFDSMLHLWTLEPF